MISLRALLRGAKAPKAVPLKGRPLAALLALVLALSGCGSVSIDRYAGQQPAFVPEQFFDGRLVAHGMVKNRGGEVTRRFRADILAYWRDGIGTLEEDFVFADGERSRRVWRLEPDGKGGYIGTAGDVVGEGVVSVAGNAMFLEYVLRVPLDDGEIDLSIDDRMYLIEEDVLLNESVMRKFGIRVGDITLVIRRIPSEQPGGGVQATLQSLRSLR
jgi:hypothetical protein